MGSQGPGSFYDFSHLKVFAHSKQQLVHSAVISRYEGTVRLIIGNLPASPYENFTLRESRRQPSLYIGQSIANAHLLPPCRREQRVAPP